MDIETLLAAGTTFGFEVGTERGDSVEGNVSIQCPLAQWTHGDPTDQNMSCSVSYGPRISLARCFSSNCNFKGSFFRMLSQAAYARGRPQGLLDFLKTIQAAEEFGLKAKLQAITAPAGARRRPPHDLPDSVLEEFKAPIHSYAAGRGITPESWGRWELGFDRRLARVTFPVRRREGCLVGITGRDVTGGQAKYHNYFGLRKTHFLYGEHLAVVGAPLVIVEGQIDTILTATATGYSVVSPLGEGFSPNHVRTIMDINPSRIILFPDNDAAGLLQAEKEFDALVGRFTIQVALPPPTKDPADLPASEIVGRVKGAKTILGSVIRWSRV